MEDHSILVYRRQCLPKDHCWIVDCEEHSVSHHSWLFSDAIGRAMLHRGAAIR